MPLPTDRHIHPILSGSLPVWLVFQGPEAGRAHEQVDDEEREEDEGAETTEGRGIGPDGVGPSSETVEEHLKGGFHKRGEQKGTTGIEQQRIRE